VRNIKRNDNAKPRTSAGMMIKVPVLHFSGIPPVELAHRNRLRYGCDLFRTAHCSVFPESRKTGIAEILKETVEKLPPRACSRCHNQGAKFRTLIELLTLHLLHPLRKALDASPPPSQLQRPAEITKRKPRLLPPSTISSASTRGH